MSTSTSVSLHYHRGDPSPTIETRLLAGMPALTIGPWPQEINVHLSTPAHARDLAADLAAVARSLDAWADTVDPDPITAAAERLVATHEDVAS
jgi:hypothetical protein